MSKLSFPILFLNLGGEMMYIIDQRLTAQKVPTDRSVKVMHEIIETMFQPALIDTLFTPQVIHGKPSVRSLFEKLCHASIMKLNAASMSKLFDLMTMAVKYQVCLATTARELLFVTLNHLYSVFDYLKTNATVRKSWQTTVDRFIKTYEPLSIHQWTMIRRSLLNYFQDETIRVSIFLKENIQNQNGKFKYPIGAQLCMDFEIPGTIKSFDASGKLKRINKFPMTDKFTVATKRPSTLQTGDKMTKLGFNMYANNKGIETQKVVKKHDSSAANKSDFDSYQSDPNSRHQLNLLSKLLSGKETTSSGNFKLNLFKSDMEETNANSGSPVVIIEEAESNVVIVDASKGRNKNRFNDVLKDLDVGDGGGDDNDLDLLDLMDKS